VRVVLNFFYQAEIFEFRDNFFPRLFCFKPHKLFPRFVGHSRSDPGAYRPEGELERWKERDPILLLRAQLEAEGVDAAALDELEQNVADELEQMRERGLAAPFPTELTAREFKD